MTDFTHPDPQDDPGAPAGIHLRLHDLLDGRLDDADAEAVRARIEREPAVREAWDELRRVQALVRDQGLQDGALEPPADFLARVRARIDQARRATASTAASEAAAAPSAGVTPHTVPAPRARPGRLLRTMTLAYAAAALLVVGFTVRYVFLEDQPPPRTLDTAEVDTAEVDTADVGIAEESLDRKLSREAGRVGADAYKEAPQQPADGGQRSARGEPEAAAFAETKAKARAASEPSRDQLPPPADARGRSSPVGARGGGPSGAPGGGPFGAPGGAVRPGLRPPATDTPPPVEPPAEAAGEPGAGGRRPAEVGRMLDAVGAREIVYVLEVRDAAEARRELSALLGDGVVATLGVLETTPSKRAGEPARSEPAQDKDAPARADGAKHKRPDGGLVPEAEEAGGKLAKGPAPRLYRVDAAEARRLLAALAVPARAREKKAAPAEEAAPEKRAAAEDERDDETHDAPWAPRLALLDWLTPDVDAAAAARLEERAVSGPWGQDALGVRRKNEGAPAPAAAPAPTTPSAPKPAGDAADAAARAAEAARRAGAKGLGAKAGAPRPPATVRVRILLLERR